jgi:hypothetical protein
MQYTSTERGHAAMELNAIDNKVKQVVVNQAVALELLCILFMHRKDRHTQKHHRGTSHRTGLQIIYVIMIIKSCLG